MRIEEEDEEEKQYQEEKVIFTVRYEPPKETALDHLTKFRVVVPKHILRAAKMEAKRFPYTFLVSCEFPASVRMVVVVANLPQTDSYKKSEKKTLKLKLSSLNVFFDL